MICVVTGKGDNSTVLLYNPFLGQTLFLGEVQSHSQVCPVDGDIAILERKLSPLQPGLRYQSYILFKAAAHQKRLSFTPFYAGQRTQQVAQKYAIKRAWALELDEVMA